VVGPDSPPARWQDSVPFYGREDAAERELGGLECGTTPGPSPLVPAFRDKPLCLVCGEKWSVQGSSSDPPGTDEDVATRWDGHGPQGRL